MKTRYLPVCLMARVEHRTDGWYYEHPDTKDFEGPYHDVREVADSMADYLEDNMRTAYRALYGKAPR
jgi:hypothetical protein